MANERIFNRRDQIELFDFLRGIAIFLVFFYHLLPSIYGAYEVETNQVSDFKLFSDKYWIINATPFSYGWIGVNLFLIISGFLIHYSYLKSNNFSYLNFFKRRFWRIVPPYLIILFYFSFCIGYSISIKSFLYHSFFIHNLFDSEIHTISPSFWSIALEAQLYILYPILIFCKKHIGIKWFFLFTLILSISTSVVDVILFKNSSIAFSSSILKFWFVWCLGAVLAESYFNGKRFINFSKYHLVVGFIIISLLRFSYFHNFSFYYISFYIFLVIDFMLFRNKLTNENRSLLTMISRKIFNLISIVGICSYSIYLIHQLTISRMINDINLLWLGKLNQNFKLLDGIIIFVIIFLISYSYYLWVELKSIEFGKRGGDYLTRLSRFINKK
jgi:peptidoglycan/LPS O-acetylase OafA/YrhL